MTAAIVSEPLPLSICLNADVLELQMAFCKSLSKHIIGVHVKVHSKE